MKNKINGFDPEKLLSRKRNNCKSAWFWTERKKSISKQHAFCITELKTLQALDRFLSLLPRSNFVK